MVPKLEVKVPVNWLKLKNRFSVETNTGCQYALTISNASFRHVNLRRSLRFRRLSGIVPTKPPRFRFRLTKKSL